MLIISCNSLKPEPQIIIKYVVPDIYFPDVPDIEFKWCVSEQHVGITEEELDVLLLYMKETKETFELLNSLK